MWLSYAGFEAASLPSALDQKGDAEEESTQALAEEEEGEVRVFTIVCTCEGMLMCEDAEEEGTQTVAGEEEGEVRMRTIV